MYLDIYSMYLIYSVYIIYIIYKYTQIGKRGTLLYNIHAIMKKMCFPLIAAMVLWQLVQLDR